MTTRAILSPHLLQEFHPTETTDDTADVRRQCVTIADVDFDNVTMDEAVQKIVWMAQQKDRPRHICTGNLDHLVLLQKDSAFRASYDSADLILADGMPIVWLSRGQRNQPPLRERVTGSDLFWELGNASAEHGLRLFFLGGVPDAAQLAAEEVRKRYPGANIVGTYCPPYETFGTEEEQDRIAEAIHDARPDILLVALGAAKQEKWIVQHKERLGVPVSIGVGGSFEMASGFLQRAPVWMQRIGMEWCFRMVQEPKRLFHRYLCQDLPFLIQLLLRGQQTTTNTELATQEQ